MVSIESRFNNRNYFLNQEQLKMLGGKQEETAPTEEMVQPEETPKIRRKDPFAQMPVRALGYSNELGEAIRPLSPLLANLSWLPAIAYISADITDKYKQDEYSNQDPSKNRASKQLAMQLLASVFLPTAAVKAGQAIVDTAAKFTKSGLSLTNREKISDVVVNSMKAGEHKNYLDENGLVDKTKYKESLADKFDEILKHRKTHEKQNSVQKVFSKINGFFSRKNADVRVKKYAGTIVDRLVDERQQLLDGAKPENLSKKAFLKFLKKSRTVSAEEKQSLAFDAIRKMEKGRMFNNRIIKSIGGLVALAVMAKPIDRFVENVIIDKYVGPVIDKVDSKYKQHKNG